MRDYKKYNHADDYKDFEFTTENIEALKDSDFHSPISKDDKAVDLDVTKYGKAPRYEDEDNTAFWTELTDVAWKVHLSRNCDSFDDNSLCDWDELGHDKLKKGKKYVSRFMEEKLGVSSPAIGAQLVRADFPTDIVSQLAGWLYANGAKPREIFQQKGYTRFTNGPVLLGRILGESVHRVSPNAFAAKYHYKRPRPEQEIGRWVRGEITAPEWADKMLKQCVDEEMVKEDQRKFTMYEEGSPKFHWSRPAMHAAAAAICIIFKVWFDLDEEMEDEITRTAYNISIFRDFAGVHYESDDLLGLEIGEEVMAKQMVDILLNASAEQDELDLKMDANELRALTESKRTHWLD